MRVVKYTGTPPFETEKGLFYSPPATRIVPGGLPVRSSQALYQHLTIESPVYRIAMRHKPLRYPLLRSLEQSLGGSR